MDVEILLDIGENSNSNKLQKLQKIGAEVLPALNNNGAGIVIRPEAPAVLATQIIESMNMDSNDFLEDYNTEEFRQRAMESVEKQTKDAELAKQLEQQRAAAEVDLQSANVQYTRAQAKNTMDDNSRQLAVSIDKHFQEWADLNIKAAKEGTEVPQHPSYNEILMMAQQILGGRPNGNSNN